MTPDEPLTDEQKAERKAQQDAEDRARFLQEKQAAYDAMQVRNANRIADLTASGQLKPGETLEEFDTRMANEAKQ